MPKVKRTIVESCCRGGYHRAGQEFLVEDLCPPLCHERWNSICPGSTPCAAALPWTAARPGQSASTPAAPTAGGPSSAAKPWRTMDCPTSEKPHGMVAHAVRFSFLILESMKNKTIVLF